jgi:hemerythrin-like domain-containing protein
MKRDEALRPLSREHLNALHAAKVLREGNDLAAVTEVFLDFWENEGRGHFRIEEEVLLPRWARYAEVDRSGVARMLEEHLAIRREALRLKAGEVSMEQARDLGRLLHDHVRFEERELFPLIEEALDAAGLAELAADIETAGTSSPPTA